jgi:hypothetical protein
MARPLRAINSGWNRFRSGLARARGGCGERHHAPAGFPGIVDPGVARTQGRPVQDREVVKPGRLSSLLRQSRLSRSTSRGCQPSSSGTAGSDDQTFATKLTQSRIDRLGPTRLLPTQTSSCSGRAVGLPDRTLRCRPGIPLTGLAKDALMNIYRPGR